MVRIRKRCTKFQVKPMILHEIEYLWQDRVFVFLAVKAVATREWCPIWNISDGEDSNTMNRRGSDSTPYKFIQWVHGLEDFRDSVRDANEKQDHCGNTEANPYR